MKIIPRLNLRYKQVPVQYRQFENGLFTEWACSIQSYWVTCAILERMPGEFTKHAVLRSVKFDVFEALNRGDLKAFTNDTSELKSLTCNGSSGQHFILNKEHFLLWLFVCALFKLSSKSYS